MRADAVACRSKRERRAPALPAAAPPPQVTSPMRTAHGVRVSAGRRGRSMSSPASILGASQVPAGRSRTARAVGGSAAAERVGGGVEALVEAPPRGCDDARVRPRDGA